jgi:hypothetical protein
MGSRDPNSIAAAASTTYDGAGYRARTGDIQLGKDQAAIAAVRSPYQPCEKTGILSRLGFQPPQALAANSRKFAAGLLLEPEQAGGASDEPLLSVADVARRLAVSTATVYGLCGSGKLAHVRLLNVIRIRPQDLRKLIDAGTWIGRSCRSSRSSQP